MPLACISGGSKGIGLAIARKFFEQGYTVVITGRDKAALAAAATAMPGLETIVCDMANRKAVMQLAAQLSERFGALDLLVNNAGVFAPGALHDEPESNFDLMMRTNLESAYFLTKGVLPAMMARRSGAIVNICSVASLKAYPNGGAYAISKAALLAFSRNLREEMIPYNIRVMSVMPGAVRTASWDGTPLPDERFIPVEDIGQMIWDICRLSPRTVVEEILIRPFEGDI